MTERCDKGWQPIETAPKDGTWVLAIGRPYRKRSGWTPVIAMLWENGEWSYGCDCDASGFKPLLWRWPPDPPCVNGALEAEDEIVRLRNQIKSCVSCSAGIEFDEALKAENKLKPSAEQTPEQET